MAKKKTIIDFRRMVAEGEKIVYITGYDYLTAKYEERAGVDMILVGDSLGNVALGYDSTYPVTMDDMIAHCKAVRRGAPNTFIVGDMPFMSYQVSDEQAVANAGRFIKEAGCDCIKLEGQTPATLKRIKAISEAGILVMGHIGLTPQFGTQMGGNRAQGKSCAAGLKIVKGAMEIEKAGADMLLVEGVPSVVGKCVKEKTSFPVLSIGAGPYVDGQLIIYADMLGYFDDFTPKFVKRYAEVGSVMLKAFEDYTAEVKAGQFPIDGEHTYKIDAEEAAALEKAVKELE